MIIGPGILGEGKKEGIGMDKPHKKFIVEGKEQMLDDYRDMVKAATERKGFAYVDIRKEFLAQSKDRSWFCGFVTMDG